MTRYDFGPLARAMGCSENQAVNRLGISGKQGQEYRHRGVTERAADRLAVKAGLVPYAIWPDLLDAQIERERERRRKIARESARRRYHSDPAVRAKKLAAVRAYKATAKAARKFQPHRSPEARREANRRYYERHAERLKAEARARYAAKAGRDPQGFLSGSPQDADGTVAA